MNYKANPKLRIWNETVVDLTQPIYVPLEKQSFWAMPLRYKNFGIFGSMTGRMWSLNLDSGSVEEIMDLPGTIYSSPLWMDGDSFWGTDNGVLTRLSFSTSADYRLVPQIKWQINVEKSIHGNINFSADHKTIYLPVYDRGVVLVDAETGKEKKVIPCQTGVDEDPYAAPMPLQPGYFAIGTQHSEIIFNDDGVLQKEFKTDQLVDSTPAYHADLNRMVFCSEDGSISVVDTKTFELIKTFDSGAKISSSPALFQNFCAIGNQSDKLHILDLTNLEIRNISLGKENPSDQAKNRENKMHYTGISTYQNGFCFVDGVGRLNFFDPIKWEHRYVSFKNGVHTPPLIGKDGIVLVASHSGEIHALKPEFLK
jgi:hypothetical protein